MQLTYLMPRYVAFPRVINVGALVLSLGAIAIAASCSDASRTARVDSVVIDSLIPPPPPPPPPPQTQFSVWPDTNALFSGMTRALAARIITPPTSIVKVTDAIWSTSDPNVVSVDGAGQITTTTVGHATVTAVSGSRTSSAEVYVVNHPQPFQFVTIVGGSFQQCGLARDGNVYCTSRPLPVSSAAEEVMPGLEGPMDRCEITVYVNLQPSYLHHRRCSEIPIRLSAPSSFDSLALENAQGCGLTPSGVAYCWGSNTYGQLGIGSRDEALHEPTELTGAPALRAIFHDPWHNCGIAIDGAAYCWGWNIFGSLGTGSATTDVYATPQRVAGNLSWRVLSLGGDAMCGLTADSTAYCWGWNFGAVAEQGCGPPCGSTPVPITVPEKLIGIAARDPLRCGLSVTGKVYCWGRAPPYTTAVLIPSAVSLVTVGEMNGIGDTAPCGLTSAGDVYCVFLLTPSALTAVDLGGIKLVRFSSNCGIATDGRAYCWSGTPPVAKAVLGQ